MSRLNKTILGVPSGKAGDVIFKIRKGKPYFSSAPAKIKKSNSEKAVEARDRLKLVSPLCKAIDEDHYLKILWENSIVPGETARHKIMKINYRLLAWKNEISDIVMIPYLDLADMGFQSYEWGEDSLKINIAPLAAKKLQMYYPEIALHGIMHLKGGNKKAHDFISLSSNAVAFQENVPLTFFIDFTNDDKEKMSRYEFKAVLLAWILKNKSREPALYSDSIYIEA